MLVHRPARPIVIGILAALCAAGSAQAQVWTVGRVDNWAYGATAPHGRAFAWNTEDLAQYMTFDAFWHNGTVCTALSPNLEYAAVEWSYRNGELWWCEDGFCNWVSGGGYVAGIDDAGDMWGSSSAANCYGVLWTDAGAARWDYPQWYRITARTHDAVTVTHPDAHRTQETLARYDANCDGRIDNFDIDPFLMRLFGWWPDPPCNTFWYDNFDIEPFVEALTP